jgi:hypothetical protein
VDRDPVEEELIRREAQRELAEQMDQAAEATLERDRALRAFAISVTGITTFVLPLLGAVVGVALGLVFGVAVVVYRLVTTGNIGW